MRDLFNMNCKTTKVYTMNKVVSHFTTLIVQRNDNAYQSRQKDTGVSSASLS